MPCYLKELGHVVCGDWLIPGARVLPEYSVESDDSYQGVDSMGGVRLPQLNAFTSKAAWTCLEQVVKRSSSAACNLEVLFSMRASRKVNLAVPLWPTNISTGSPTSEVSCLLGEVQCHTSTH